MENGREIRVDLSALYRSIVQSADDAISSLDLNETITSWNRAAEKLYGYDANEVIGQSNRLLIPPDRYSEEDDVIRRVKSGEGVQHHDTVRVRKDGSRIEVAITASAILQDGNIIGVSKIARDISERKKAERNGARLAAIVESSDDPIVAKDLNGIITSWNRAAERMHGEDDQIVPVKDSAKKSAKLIKGAVEIYYPGLPHGLTATHSDLVNRDLLAFCQQGKRKAA